MRNGFINLGSEDLCQPRENNIVSNDFLANVRMIVFVTALDT